MKKTFFLAVILSTTSMFAHAQLMPKFQMGVKAGANLTQLSSEGLFKSENRAGYLGGIWARVGAGGLHFQPELYLTGKNTLLKDAQTGDENMVKFTSVDMPLLLGTKFGAAGFGVRLQTGPLVSFITNQEQSVQNAVNNAIHLRYKDQALAWQFGAGLDIQKLSVDLRYETGLTKLSESGYAESKIKMFNISLGYRLF